MLTTNNRIISSFIMDRNRQRYDLSNRLSNLSNVPFSSLYRSILLSDMSSSMRDAAHLHGLDMSDDQQQIQGMLMASAPTPNPMSFLRQNEPMNVSPRLLQQQQQLQGNTANSWALQQQSLNQFQPSLQASDLLSRYQQHHQMQNQQLFDQSTATNANYLTSTLGQPTLQEMMLMRQQQQQQQQAQQQQLQLQLQQQQYLGNDAALSTLNMGLGGFGNASSNVRRPYSLQAQQQQQQQLWGNDLTSSLLQPSLQDQVQLQQLQLLQQQQQQQHFLGNSNLDFQSQFELEQQRRRRSSMSSTRSLSPIGPGSLRPPTLGMSNANLLHSTDYSQLLTSNTAPIGQPSLSHLQHHPTQASTYDSNNNNNNASIRTELISKDSKKKKNRTFPEKLMQAMLERENENAVAWLPDGKSFVIVSPDLFVNEVLNTGFKQAKYASFVRKLHRWGFIRLTSGTGTDCFHHALFNLTNPSDAARITCAPMKEGKMSSTAIKSSQRQQQQSQSQKSPISAVKKITVKPPSLAGVERFIRARVSNNYNEKVSSVGGGSNSMVDSDAATAVMYGNRSSLTTTTNHPTSITKQVLPSGHVTTGSTTTSTTRATNDATDISKGI